MRHGKKNNHLGRTASHRNAMLSNMATSLILNKRIITTVAKAKELRKFVEPLLTKSKEDNTHNRRVVFSYLQSKEAIKALFGEISEKIANRNGGYTRIIKLGQRQGDAAETAMIELVDYNELLLTTTSDAPAKAKRTRRAGAGKKSADASPIAAAEVVEEVTSPADSTATTEVETSPSGENNTDLEQTSENTDDSPSDTSGEEESDTPKEA